MTELDRCLMRFECEMSPVGPYVWTFGLQLVTLCGKLVEPLRGGALLEEVDHWGWVLKFYHLLHFLLTCCFLTADVMWQDGHLFPWRCCFALIDCAPWNHQPPKISSLNCFWQVFSQSNQRSHSCCVHHPIMVVLERTKVRLRETIKKKKTQNI